MPKHPPFDNTEAAPDYPINAEYLGHLQIALTGRHTGLLYRFSPRSPVQQIDSRDAFFLLESGLFGIAQ